VRITGLSGLREKARVKHWAKPGFLGVLTVLNTGLKVVPNGPSGRLLTQLEALRDLLLGAKLNCGPVLPMPFEMKWDEELPANAILAAKEMFYLRAGTVSFAVLVGENE